MTSEPSANTPPRYWSLDVLRGTCALTVFLSHWLLWSNFTPVGMIQESTHRWLKVLYQGFTWLTWPTGAQHPAVICFFVLSGFCVHLPFERRIASADSRVRWRDYFMRRTRRIMPVYWTGALLGLVAVGLHHYRPTGDGLLILHTIGTPVQIAARLGGWSGLWPEEIFAGNYTLGTVGVEILIYAVYPVIFRLAADGRWLLMGTIAFGLQFLALSLRNLMDPFVLFSGVLVMSLFWYLGALAAHWRQTRAWRVRGRWLGVLWALFLALQSSPRFFGLSMIKQLIWGLICMGGIVWLVDWEQRHSAWREHVIARVLRWTGDISYPLYATHTPVMLLINWGMLVLLAAHNYAWQLALNLLLPFVVAVMAHYGVERRFYRARPA